MKPDLSVEICGMRWRNPLTTASGTMAGWENYERLMPLDTFGALTVKSVTLRPRPGNPAPRLAEVESGLLNSIGIPNQGVEAFLSSELPRVRAYGVPVIVSIAGHSIEEFVALARRLDGVPGISALEVNMSCPNIGRETLEFGQAPEEAERLTRALRAATDLPLIPKLTPNCADPAAVARAVVRAGADAVSLINTVIGMAIDIESQLPRTGTPMAGLSGPAVKPIALRMVWEVSAAVDVPVIGMGGIMTAADAIEFLLAGAAAVALGTVNFVNPRAATEILAGIEAYMAERGLAGVRELTGLARRRWRERPHAERLYV